MSDAASKPPELVDESFGERVARLIEKGRSWELNWSAQVADAWRSVESRLESQEAGKGQLHASVAETLCAARLLGPSPIPGLDLEHVSLSDWSRVVLDRMSTRELHIEPRLLTFALRRLGADNLFPGAAERLLMAIDPELSVDQRARARAQARATSRREPAGAQLAIVVRTTQNSLTNGWALQPTLGMVLMVEAKDLRETKEPKNDTADVIGRVLKVLQQTPVLLAWEEPPDSADEQKEVLERFARHYEGRVRPIYLYASETMAVKSPVVVDPRGPDALFRQHGNERPRA